MTYCPLITLTLKIISVRCIPLNLRSKTRRRETLLLPTWIYFCQSVGTVNLTLPFTRSVTILISILQTFRSWAAKSHLRPPMAFLSQLIRYARASCSYECFLLREVRLSNKLLGQGYVKECLRSSLRKFYGRYGDLIKPYDVPSLECYTTFWVITIYSDTLHWSGITPIFDLITEFDFLLNCERFS